MRIEWDAPISMDDGVVLRADVFRPSDKGRHPVILSYGPYAKGLSFQEGYKSNWARLSRGRPRLAGSSIILPSNLAGGVPDVCTTYSGSAKHNHRYITWRSHVKKLGV